MENQNGFPGALPAIPSGLEGGQVDLVPGEGFWARIEQIAVKGDMTRGLDTAMHGRPSPRIWLFLHEPGRGELSAAVAMSFARELAFRDQAALVLDCDDQDQALTRWAGRVEAEGWIDLARYGTSVLTSGMPMPFVGRRGYLLGVGSLPWPSSCSNAYHVNCNTVSFNRLEIFATSPLPLLTRCALP